MEEMEESLLSTSWLNFLRSLHLTPIKPIVFRQAIGISHLEACFALKMLSVLIRKRYSYPAMPF